MKDEMRQLSMLPRKKAHARRTDPETSHEAAASIEGTFSDDQSKVIHVLHLFGSMTDSEIYEKLWEVGYRLSPSGARTRRHELVELGKVKFAEEYRKLQSGRRSRVWRLKSENQAR